jgi:hypothetical protein
MDIEVILCTFIVDLVYNVTTKYDKSSNLYLYYRSYPTQLAVI